MNDQPKPSSSDVSSLHAEVDDRFGVLPNFFRLAPEAPEITQNLWGFAKFGYLDNPLPSLFKERLFVYLSQFCNVRYCISRHVGFLVGLGLPAGDQDCPPQSVEQIVRLLRVPLPRGAGLEPYIQYCRAQELAIEDLPSPETFAEEAFFACASHVFLQTEEASRCLQALSQMLDAVTHQHLLVFLTFVRTAHFWTKLHPELQHESDITELLGVHESLAQCVLNEQEEAHSESTQILLDELVELRKEREQAELLRVTLASIGDAVIATDPHGRVTTMNAVAEKLTGWTNQSASGKPLESVFNIVNEATRQEVENPALRALKEGVIVGLANHTILIAKDGSETPIDDSAAPIRSIDGEVLGSVLVFRDITERQRVQKSERLLASVVESSDDAIITKSLDGIIQSWNVSAERIFGYSKEEAVGRHISMLIPDERLDEEDQIISRLRASERIEHFETVRTRSDGRSLYVSLTVSPIKDAEGKVIGASKIARDITKHKLAEAALQESEIRYRMIGEAANDAIWDWNLITNQVTWNEGVQTLTGFQVNQIGSEASWWLEHIHPDDRERVSHSIHVAIDRGDESWHEQYRFQRYDNSYAIVFDRGRIIHDENGKSIRMIGAMLDLTEKLAAEAQLSETRSRLDSTLAAAEIGTWEFDPIQNLVKADANLARMFGVNAEEQVDGSLESYLNAIHPDDRERVTATIEHALETQSTYDTEYRLLDNEAKVRWVVARGRVERDETGRAIRLPGVVMDISERKLAEKALQESEAQLHMALDSAELGSWNIDPARNYLATDERFRVIFHGSTDPITYEEAFSKVHPDDQERIRIRIAEATRLDNPTPYAEEYRVVHPNGEIHWVFAKGRSNFEETEQEGRIVSFDGTLTDITDRKRTEAALLESEEKLRLLFDTIPQLAWMAHPNGDIFWYNTRWYEYTGTTPSEMGGWGWQSVHDPQVLPQVIERWQNSIDSGQAFDMTFPLRGADTQFRPFLTRINPLRNDSGEIQYWFGTNTDVSEQTRIQEELREVAARLSEEDRRKTEFLATLGHELRNPLAPIRTGLEVMKMSLDDPATIEEVRSMMERQVQQMVRLIDDLLDVSRITQGKMVLRTSRVDLAEIVQSAVEATRTFIDEGGHELTVTLPQQKVILDADPNRLSQVLSNLMNNSAKYTPDGGHIWLSCEHDASEVVMTVKDDGLGIPPDMLEKIFEMFTQIDRPLEEGYTGLGIGLTLVKRLVEMHGGTIEVKSEGAGKGSEFKVRLPILNESVITVATPKISVATKKLRILVVDDNKAAATMLKMVVKMLGNEVRTAHDGQHAIEVAAEFLPDVVLMDLGMPKMNGYEAAQYIRKQSWGKDILLVALTGWGQDEDKERTQAAGFDHHLVKPAEPDAIQQLLATVNT